mmetsp:Transcript_37743/g.94592  ORF Transcript_37743/g.94592 Transcript_37743/m.94592 type:complete len:249 (+) Transcript_37743:2171-2917(+)
MPHSIIQRIPPKPILCGDISFVLQQQLHHRKVPFARRQVKGSTRVVVSLHGFHPILQQPLNLSNITHTGSLAQLNTCLRTRQIHLVLEILDVHLGLLLRASTHLQLFQRFSRGRGCVRIPYADEGCSLVVLFPHCIVERRVLEEVLHPRIRIHGKKKPACFRVSFRSSDVQRSSTEGIRVVRPLAVIDQLLQALNVATCCSSTHDVDGVCPPPGAQRRHLGLEAPPEHHVKFLALSSIAAVGKGGTSF